MSKEIVKLNDHTGIDLPKLLESRMLLQANSGGGKSWAIRRIVEQSFGKTQIIIIDVEGEFSTLREKYDFVLAGKGGDTPADPRSAALLARRLLELKVSAIIDIYELPNHEKRQFVKLFLDALVHAPKELWPVNYAGCLVVVDEAHRFAPEKGQSEALQAVESLTSLGRKRGLCAILATQRISKLHKDAAAECNNKMIGRSSLDIDMSRAAEELGFNTKEQKLSLRDLEAGEFYVFGTAISKEVKKITVGEVHTTHRLTKKQKIKLIPPTAKIKALLPQLSDLPAEAKKEAATMESLKAENAGLRQQLRVAGTAKNFDPKDYTPNDQAARMVNEAVARAEKEFERHRAIIVKNFIGIKHRFESFMQAGQKITELFNGTETIADETPNYPLPQDFKRTIKRVEVKPLKPIITPLNQAIVKPIDQTFPDTETSEVKIQGGALRMLTVLVSRYPTKLTKSQLGTFAKMKARGGSFGTYLSTLKSAGLIAADNGYLQATETGIEFLGEQPAPPQTSDEVIEMWRNNLQGGARRMFDALVQVYPQGYSKEELGGAAEVQPSGGSFGTYLSILRSNDLVEVSGGNIKASDNLFQL